MNVAEKVLRRTAAAAIRVGNDDEHARAVAALDAWLGRSPVATTEQLATEVRPMTSTERSRVRRQRLNATGDATGDATECNVACNGNGNVAPVALEGVGGGLVQGISPVSVENETVIPDQNSSLSDPIVTLSQPGRARARAPRKGSTTKATGVPEDGPELDAWVALHGFEQDRRDNPDDFAAFVRHHRGKGNRWVNWPDARANWKAKPWNQAGAATNVRTFRDARPVQRWTAEQAAQPTINWADDDDEPAKETA